MIGFLVRWLFLSSVLVGIIAIGIHFYLGPGWSVDDVGDLKGKVAIITGANAGLGYETAKALAKAGCHVIMACRSQERCEKAAQSIREYAANAHVSPEVVDLSEPDSVRNFAARCSQNIPHLDYLINNAGVFAIPEQRNSHGWEMQIAINHLGHFQLFHHLLELLERSHTHIVNHAAILSHQFWSPQPVNLTDLTYQKGRHYTPMQAYSQSKRANLWFTYEINRRYGAKGITATSCHPGVSATEIQSKAHGTYFPDIVGIVHSLSMSAAQGALPQLYATLKAEPDQYIGPRFLNWGPPALVGTSLHVFPFPADDPADAQALWEISAEITGLS